MDKPFNLPAPPQPGLSGQSAHQGPSTSTQKHFIVMNPSSSSTSRGALSTSTLAKSVLSANEAAATFDLSESAVISHSHIHSSLPAAAVRSRGGNEILITLDHQQESRKRVPLSPNLHTVGDAHSFLPAVPGPYDFVDECNDDAREHDNEPLIIRGSARQGRMHQFLTAMKLGSSNLDSTTVNEGAAAAGPVIARSLPTKPNIPTGGKTERKPRLAKISRRSPIPERASISEDPRWNHSISTTSSSAESSTRCSRVSLEATPAKTSKFPMGIILAAFSCVFFATTSLIVKVSSVHPMELLAARGFIQGLCVLPIAISSKADILGTNQNIRSLLLARGILGSAALIMSFISIHLIALADSSTLIFTSPVFVSIFACLCLGEVCQWFDMLMIALTLMGVIFVSKPSFQFLNPNTNTDNSGAGTNSWDGVVGSMCGLSAALFTALAFIILRQLKQIHYSVIILWFSVILASFGTVLTIALGAFTLPSDWCSITQCLGVGLCGFMGQVLLTKALQIETATTVAIARTLDIVFAFLLQIILLHDTPDVFSCLGSVLVVSCVVLTACRGRHAGNANGVSENGNSDGVAVAGSGGAGGSSTCSTVRLNQEDAA